MIVAALLLALGPAESLHALIDRDWAWRMAESPQFATTAGVHDFDDRLEKVDEATQQRRLRELKQRAVELQAIPRDALQRLEQVNAEVLAEELRARISNLEVHQYLITIQGDESFYSNLSLLPRNQPLRDAAADRLERPRGLRAHARCQRRSSKRLLRAIRSSTEGGAGGRGSAAT